MQFRNNRLPEKSPHSFFQCLDLSHHALSISDYEWLATVLEKTSFIEQIILPKIPANNANEILKILDKATIHNSTLTEINIDLSLLSESAKNIHSRTTRNKNRIFAIHGGGNIGLGLLADVISKSPFSYQTVATSNNKFLCNLINGAGKLWLQHDLPGNRKATTCVKNVKMISRNPEDVVQLYADANIAALCVTPLTLNLIAKDIAKGLIARYEKDAAGLKILVLMNLPRCDEHVKEIITTAMTQLTGDQLYTRKLLSRVRFVPTVADRIVTPINASNVRSQLRMQLRNKNLNEFEMILANPQKLIKAVRIFNLQFNLFKAEEHYTIAVPDSLPEAQRLPAIKVTKHISRLGELKNKYMNGPHAVLAWIGAMMGCKTIAEAINHQGIYAFIKKMMEDEISPILRAEYPDVSIDELDFLKKSFFTRAAASIDDPVTRVGRDPLRKLNKGGHIRGAIELCLKHHLKISITGLEQSLALGILYGVKMLDPANLDCQKIVDIYKENNNSCLALLTYTGPVPGGYFTGLDLDKDKLLINNVMRHFIFLEKNLNDRSQ